MSLVSTRASSLTPFYGPTEPEMFSFTNNSTFGTPFGRGDDRERSRLYPSTSRQQNAPAMGNSSCSELHWTGGPHRESYMLAGPSSNTSSWPSTTFTSSSVYEGGVWPGDQYLDEACLGSLFGASGGNADGSGTTSLLMGMEVAAPVLEQAFPAAPRAIPAFQPCPPPSLNWAQAPGPPWQPTSSWGQPVHTRHSDHSSSIGSLGMRPEIPPFQLAASSVITGRSERRVMPTGRLPSITTPNFVQPSTRSDPVSVSPSAPRSRGERWNLSNPTTFRCLWTSRETRCAALIAGDRRSVTNHLRDEHDFACDGQTIACAWGECTVCMQRRNIPRHIVACHFAIKVTCSQCGMALSRADANKKHRLACTGVRTPAVVEATKEDEGGYF